MLRIAASIALLLCAGPALGQPPPPPFVAQPVRGGAGGNATVEMPIPADQGRLLHGGVWFIFGEGLSRGHQDLGQAQVVFPADTPAGQPVRPGQTRCRSSFDAALDQLAALARERGGEAVIHIATDVEGAPVSRRNYVCENGRVRLVGRIVRRD